MSTFDAKSSAISKTERTTSFFPSLEAALYSTANVSWQCKSSSPSFKRLDSGEFVSLEDRSLLLLLSFDVLFTNEKNSMHNSKKRELLLGRSTS